MERQVIFRDRQELQAQDLNNLQTWADEALAHVITDAISAENHIVGLTVSARSATEILVSPGRLYIGQTGKVYFLSQEQVISVFNYLPIQDEKWLAVSVYGVEEETDIQPRDFLVDLQTGQTQPQAVAMERRRKIEIHIAQGLESPTPEKPEPPTGYTLIAYVKLNPSGIQTIEIAEHKKLPNLIKVSQRVSTLEAWTKAQEPRIASIVSDIAGINRELAQKASLHHIIQLAMDMAKVKERLELPDNYVFYGADHFLDLSETDTTQSDYSAEVYEGVRPAPAAKQNLGRLQILNPLDPNVRIFQNGTILPRFSEVVRLQIGNYKGSIQINAYQYQTTQVVQRTVQRQRIVYGEARTVCTNSAFWRSGRYDPATGIFRRGDETWQVDPAYRQNALIYNRPVRLTRFWYTTYEEPYWDVITVTHTVNGSIIAQTFLAPFTGWLTSLDLYFATVDTQGGLTLMLTEATNGQPDMRKVIAKLDLAPNALNAGWCNIPFQAPVFIEAGKRYAIILSTSASHRVGYSEGTAYTQGVLMYSQDGQFFVEAAERDLMMRLKFAQFDSPLVTVQLQPLQLEGGIHDIDILWEGITPDGCELIYEYQIGGIWYPIRHDTAERLRTAPALLPLRVTFVGTTDLMPSINLNSSQVIVARYGTRFKHYSTMRTLATASSNIIVRILVEGYKADKHTISCKLKSGTNIISPASTSEDILLDGSGKWIEYRFQPTSAISQYRIVLEGQTSDPFDIFHVAARYDIAL